MTLRIIIFIDQDNIIQFEDPATGCTTKPIELVGGAEKEYVGGNENFVQQFARRHVDSFIDGLWNSLGF